MCVANIPQILLTKSIFHLLKGMIKLSGNILMLVASHLNMLIIIIAC